MARAGPATTAVVRAALDLFHARFTYTLNPPLLGRDSIDDFLFSTQQWFLRTLRGRVRRS